MVSIMRHQLYSDDEYGLRLLWSIYVLLHTLDVIEDNYYKDPVYSTLDQDKEFAARYS